jgi:hypothetical protein
MTIHAEHLGQKSNKWKVFLECDPARPVPGGTLFGPFKYLIKHQVIQNKVDMIPFLSFFLF